MKNITNTELKDKIAEIILSLNYVEASLLAWDIEKVNFTKDDLNGLQFLITKVNKKLKKNINKLE